MTYDESNEYKKHLLLLAYAILMVIWSYFGTEDYFAWYMLTLPSVAMMVGFSLTYRRFQFTTLTYFVVFMHILILVVGARYRYAGCPLFLELKEIFNLKRNYFDRVGHFMQGFAPFFLVRDFVLRKGYVIKSKFTTLMMLAFVLAISATWELLEFLSALITKKPASYILSSQGVLWDTQWDMILAIIGGLTALIFFRRQLDKQIEDRYESDEKKGIMIERR